MEPFALFVSGLAAGLLSGTASCTAVQGGMLIGLAVRRSGASSPACDACATAPAAERSDPAGPAAVAGRPAPVGTETAVAGDPLGGSAPRTATAAATAPASFPAPPPSPSPDPEAAPAPEAAEESDPRVVSMFILGRLASHTLAGAFLGLVGGVVRLEPPVRALLLVAGGLLVIGLAVRTLLRRKAPAACRTHDQGTGPLVRVRAAVSASDRAVVLGILTIFVPCGVTLGVEVTAAASGSAVGGAAIMAGFVLGSAPGFALLGVLIRRVTATRLAAVAALVAAAVGLWTIVSGLRVGGWFPETAAAAPATAASTAPDGTQTVTIHATRNGYRPGTVVLEAGRPVELDFRLLDTSACTRTLTLNGQDVVLPQKVRLPPQPPGQLRYVCGMGMYVGFITFR